MRQQFKQLLHIGEAALVATAQQIGADAAFVVKHLPCGINAALVPQLLRLQRIFHPSYQFTLVLDLV